MHKTIALSAAAKKIPDGASVMIGGFLGVGRHRAATARHWIPIAPKAMRKVVMSHIGTNPETQQQRFRFPPCDVGEPGRLESSPRITQKLITGETVYVDLGYHNVG